MAAANQYEVGRAGLSVVVLGSWVSFSAPSVTSKPFPGGLALALVLVKIVLLTSLAGLCA